MRILLSAYACEPGKGSEPGVGWKWALELARLGHEVSVITRSNNRASIEQNQEHHHGRSLAFHYYDLPSWAKWWKRENRGIHIYYALWQWGAYRLAKRLVRHSRFDVVHHLTFGVFRQVSWMWRLGIPFVLGPVGGGESTPSGLMGSYPLFARVSESARTILNRLAALDPMLRSEFKHSSVILCKTNETLSCVPMKYRARCVTTQEVGTEDTTIANEPSANPSTPRFLYVGNLLYLKGIHLALQALAQIHRHRPDATFVVVGKGPNQQWLRSEADRLGVAHAVEWRGWVPKEQVLEMYRHYTAFVFPSLHDSSGNALMESLSQGLPVICLNTGGPAAILPLSCGFKIPVEGRSQTDVVSDLAAAMQELSENPDLRTRMAFRALEAATENTWGRVVSRAYEHVHPHCGSTVSEASDIN